MWPNICVQGVCFPDFPDFVVLNLIESLCSNILVLLWLSKLSLDRELVANEIGCPKYPNFVGNRKFDVKSMDSANLVKSWDLRPNRLALPDPLSTESLWS